MSNSKHYVETNAIKKQEFNDAWLRLTQDFMHNNADRYYAILVIEAACGRSVRTLRNAGLENPITAFTCTADDFLHIPHFALGIKKRCLLARTLYAVGKFNANVIVWHDGQQYGINTLLDIMELVDRGHESIGLGVNIVPRCGKMSHRHFAQVVACYARSCGYEITCNPHISYSQHERGGTMWAFWFELKRLPAKFAVHSRNQIVMFAELIENEQLGEVQDMYINLVKNKKSVASRTIFIDLSSD